MTRPEPAEIVRARLVARLREVLPGLDEAAALAALTAANAHRHIGLHRLDDHLRAQPGALVSASTDAPPALVRLLRHLHAAGHPVYVPVCAHCGRQTKLPEVRPGGRVCSNCAALTRVRECARCGRPGTISELTSAGPMCGGCYAADPARHELCGGCGRRARVHVRLPDGGALCKRCGRHPAAPCSRCEVTRPIARRTGNKPLCGACLQELLLPRACVRCGKITVIAVGEARNLCSGCARLAVCIECGRLRPCTGATTTAPRCKTCVPKPVGMCARCGTQRQIRALWPLGGVCAGCYGFVRAHPQRCTACGTIRPLIGRDGNGDRTCGVCAGAANPYLCATCGSGIETDRGPRCARCVLRDRLADEFTGPDGQVPAEIRPLADALLDVPRARSVLVWLDKPRSGARLLRHLVREGAAISHEALDSAEQELSVIGLRATLVHVGILEPREEPLARIAPWLERVLADLPAGHRPVVRAYAEWHVLRKARRRAARGRFTAASAAHARGRINYAISFLSWLDARQITLAGLTQAHIEGWLSERSWGWQVRHFLHWAHQRRLTGQFEIAYPGRDEPHTWWDADGQWEHLKRCLHDEQLPLDVRACGALMLLYGVAISRITKLTVDDLAEGPSPTLLLGQDPLVLPSAVYELLRRQADQARSASAITRTTPRAAWIFPGYTAGTHRSAPTLARRLRRHGLPAHPCRNTALVALAGDIPASVLSELIGISITSALQWSRRSARDWNAYLAARADQ